MSTVSTDNSDSSDLEIDSDPELLELASQTVQKMKFYLSQKTTNQKVCKKSPKNPESSKSNSEIDFVIDKTPVNINENRCEHFTSLETSTDKAAGPMTKEAKSKEDEDSKSERSEDSETDSENEMKAKQTKRNRKKGPGRNRGNKRNANKSMELSTSLQPGIDLESVSYVNIDSYQHSKKIDNMILKPSKTEDVLKKSIISPAIEKQHSIPPYEESLNQIKKQRKKARESTKGKNWFNMPAQELTEEKKNDLMVLQMRRSLDPKSFYKGPDIRGLPKYFQTGTVIEGPADFYNGRIPKKQRKKTLVDELLNDVEFRQYNKRKYTEIMESKSKGKGAYKHMKRLKKKRR